MNNFASILSLLFNEKIYTAGFDSLILVFEQLGLSSCSCGDELGESNLNLLFPCFFDLSILRLFGTGLDSGLVALYSDEDEFSFC